MLLAAAWQLRWNYNSQQYTITWPLMWNYKFQHYSVKHWLPAEVELQIPVLAGQAAEVELQGAAFY